MCLIWQFPFPGMMTHFFHLFWSFLLILIGFFILRCYFFSQNIEFQSQQLYLVSGFISNAIKVLYLNNKIFYIYVFFFFSSFFPCFTCVIPSVGLKKFTLLVSFATDHSTIYSYQTKQQVLRPYLRFYLRVFTVYSVDNSLV